jgi:hypothetical protein
VSPEQKQRSELLKLRNSRHLEVKKLCSLLPDGLRFAPLEDERAENLLAKISASVRTNELELTSDWRREFAHFLSGRSKIVIAELWDWEGSRGLLEVSAKDAKAWADAIHEIYNGCIIAIDAAADQVFVTDLDWNRLDGISEQSIKTFELAND